MERLTGQDLKTRGVTGISNALQNHDECIITIHGKATFVVMPVKQLEYYRERDLELASIEVNRDIENGDYHTDTEKHLRELLNDV